jgi:hypothetical protein
MDSTAVDAVVRLQRELTGRAYEDRVEQSPG